MRIYYEAQEQAETDPEFVRLEVTTKTQAERDAILTKQKDYMDGLTCVFTEHYCRHEDNNNTPCTMEIV